MYGDLVSVGSYLIVMDTVIRDMAPETLADRPWDSVNNPWTAVRDFLSVDDRYIVAADVNDRLLATAAPEGYLIRVR